MPKLSFTRDHTHSPGEVRALIDALRARAADKYCITASWESDARLGFTRTGASGYIQCEPGRVVVFVELAWFLLPFKGAVEARVKQELAVLGP